MGSVSAGRAESAPKEESLSAHCELEPTSNVRCLLLGELVRSSGRGPRVGPAYRAEQRCGEIRCRIPALLAFAGLLSVPRYSN